MTAATGLVLLDGASSHTRDETISGGEYAQRLGDSICHRLTGKSPARTILEESIAETAETLALTEQSAQPSSTVAIARLDPLDAHAIELLVLGDSVIVVGYVTGRVQAVSDDRMAALGLAEADLYRTRLRNGSGFDAIHQSLLADLQKAERRHRNCQGGYWIASDDPAAAHHARVMTVQLSDLAWIVVASDGVSDPVMKIGPSWSEIAQLDSTGLAELLCHLNTWESETDPDGQALPRSKRHDDKTIAAVRFPA